MSIYDEKIIYLKSLITEVKLYAFTELEVLLELGRVEKILDKPEVINCQWEYKSLYNQEIFSKFLDSYIEILERIISEIECSNKQK